MLCHRIFFFLNQNVYHQSGRYSKITIPFLSHRASFSPLYKIAGHCNKPLPCHQYQGNFPFFFFFYPNISRQCKKCYLDAANNHICSAHTQKNTKTKCKPKTSIVQYFLHQNNAYTWYNPLLSIQLASLQCLFVKYIQSELNGKLHSARFAARPHVLSAPTWTPVDLCIQTSQTSSSTVCFSFHFWPQLKPPKNQQPSTMFLVVIDDF